MKKQILGTCVLAIIFGLIISIDGVHALQGGVVDQQLQAGGGAADIATNADVRVIIADLVRYILMLIGTIFLALMFQATYWFIIARGREDYVEKARKTMLRGTVGLVIVLLAYSATVFVNRVLFETTNEGPQRTRIPQGNGIF